MAKGKHAARATKRANEAAVAHIDRLTDKLTEAKIKARQHESAARELPASRNELARLRKQIEDETSDALNRERQRLHDERAQFNEKLKLIGCVVAEIIERNDIGVKIREWGELSELLGSLDDFVEMNKTRTQRRNASRSPQRLVGQMRTVHELKDKTGFEVSL